jgi:hypothetical protein
MQKLDDAKEVVRTNISFQECVPHTYQIIIGLSLAPAKHTGSDWADENALLSAKVSLPSQWCVRGSRVALHHTPLHSRNTYQIQSSSHENKISQITKVKLDSPTCTTSQSGWRAIKLLFLPE